MVISQPKKKNKPQNTHTIYWILVQSTNMYTDADEFDECAGMVVYVISPSIRKYSSHDRYDSHLLIYGQYKSSNVVEINVR